MEEQFDLGKNVEWARKNALNPFLNGLLLEPVQAAEQIVNAGAHACGSKDLLPKVELLEVDKAEPGSAEFWVQNISSGLSFVIPYAGAGKLASVGLRCTATALKLESAAAKLGAGKQVMNAALKAEQMLLSKPAANILGGVAYDGLKDLQEGQSRAGNMGRSAAQFGTFESMNAASKLIPQTGAVGFVIKHIVAPAAIGATGGITGSLAESTINNKHVNLKELAEHAISGGALNLVLPHAQEALYRHVGVPAILQTKGSMPVSDYAASKHWGGKSAVLDLLLSRNPLAKVKTGEHTEVVHKTGTITLRNGASPEELAHELHHLQKVRREGGNAGTVNSRLEAEKVARQIENRAANQTGSAEPRQNIKVNDIANEVTPNGLTYREHFRREVERTSKKSAEAETDFAAARRTGKKIEREESASKTENLTEFENTISVARNESNLALTCPPSCRAELGWEQLTPFSWQRQSNLSSTELKQALSAIPSHWERDSFFPGTYKKVEGNTRITLKQNESLSIQTEDSTYTLSKNGTEQIVDITYAKKNQAEVKQAEILAKTERFKQEQELQNKQYEEIRKKQDAHFEAIRERRKKDAEEFELIQRDPFLRAAHAWRDTEFDRSCPQDIIDYRHKMLNDALLEKGLIKTPLDIYENRPINQWLWEIYLNPQSFDKTVRHGLRENPDKSELHHKHMMDYLKLPEIDKLSCRGDEIRAGGESLVFPLENGKDVFKIMRPKFKEQLRDIAEYGKRPFDAELRSPITVHEMGATDKILTYKQEKLEPITENQYLANPAKWNALLKKISEAGYICPDIEGKWWQVGQNNRGEWKLLDYGAAIPKRAVY